MSISTFSPPLPHWEIAPPVPPDIESELKDFSPILRQLLYNRGITTADQAKTYLNPPLSALYNPALLKGMEAAVDRIRFAIDHGERIAIYGDYDVDGVTATAILWDYLNRLGADATYHIPNRFEEGYGVRKDALDFLKNQNVKLIITVDCGVRSIPEAEHARRIGLDMIITDHHQPANELPPAISIIDPKQGGDLYPYKELAGVGLAYKLTESLENNHPSGLYNINAYLDLVALGTIADIAPLHGENRILVSHGIQSMKTLPRRGIASLMGVTSINPINISSHHIAYMLGPRLNAAGRLESALAALELLLSNDVVEASRKAQELDNQNRQRQELTHKLEEIAIQLAFEENQDPLLLFALQKDFNLGVIGLVASHLTERFYRPSIVGVYTDEFIRASCRSIPEFNITAALDECADLMEHHGGHSAAAGFTIRSDRFPELKRRLFAIAEKELSSRELRPVIKADMELDLVQGITFYKELQYLQPTGNGNPAPLFVSRNLTPRDIKLVGKDQSHLRFKVNSGWECIAFRKSTLKDLLSSPIDILYQIEKHEYNGTSYLQLNIRDIRPASQ